MTTVRAHLRLGKPVRQFQRHLGPTAKGLLGIYRNQKRFSAGAGVSGRRLVAKAKTHEAIGDLSRRYGPMFWRGLKREPFLLSKGRGIKYGAYPR
jgi:hypothetical protein